jgi:hypothetical protein
MSRRPSPAVATAIAVLALSPTLATAAPKAKPKPVVALADAGTRPLNLAAGEGRILAMQDMEPSGSRLMELVPGREPRVIRTQASGARRFSVGTDAAGRTVAVVNLCADGPRRGCDLSVVDVDTGATVPLPGSTTAYLADLDRGRAVLVRNAKKVGVRISLRAATPGGKVLALPISRVSQAADPDHLTYPKTRQILSIDLRGGVVAASVWVDNDAAGYDSLLIARGPRSRDWNLLDQLSNGDGGDGNHFFGGPVVTPTGIRAFADWGLEDDSYAGRWSVGGKRLGKVNPMRLGLDGFTGDAVISGDTLVTAPVEGFSEGPTPVLAGGPLNLG